MPRFPGKILLVIIVMVTIVMVMMRVTSFQRVQVTPLESAWRDITAPLQRVAMELGHQVRGVFSFPVSVVRSARYNLELEERVAQLEGQLQEATEYRLENERLKEIIDFRSNIANVAGMQVAVASVIGRDPGNWFSTLSINKGSNHGIKYNMTVITPQGLVGRITTVSELTAEVLLISDPRSGVGCLIQETRAPGLVEGVASGSDLLRMIYIPNNISVLNNQTVLTSGMGSIFPKGVPIGKVVGTGREASGLFISANVKPFVDFNRLEEVMIITEISPDSPLMQDENTQVARTWGLPPVEPQLPRHPSPIPH